MNILLKKIAFAAFFLCMVLAGQTACEAETADKPRVLDEDFGYKGMLLGDSAEDMLKVMGEADYDRKESVFGIQVQRYEYGDITVSVAAASNRVVDIELKGKDFRLREDIRYGSTKYWIHHVYGMGETQLLEGDICHIYERPGHRHEHLLLRTDAESGALISVKITALPLNEAEAEQMIIDGTDIEAGLVAENPALPETPIDTSALPVPEEPKLVLGGAG